MQRATDGVHCCQETQKKESSYCRVVWGQSRHARDAILFIYFNSRQFFFLFLQFLLGISVAFTSVTASSKRHFCLVRSWGENPLFRHIKLSKKRKKERKKNKEHSNFSLKKPKKKTKKGTRKKNVVMTSPADTKKKGGHLTLKGEWIGSWPVMIALDARVCWPLAQCISENDWGFWGL